MASLDLSTVPKEQEARVKQNILKSRLKRKLSRFFLILGRVISPLQEKLAEWTKAIYYKLLTLKENYREDPSSDLKGGLALKDILSEAEELVKKEDYEGAEKKYIQAISINSKNIETFKLLGALYLTMKKFPEAKETFEHVLKLTKEDAETYTHLAEIEKEKGNFEKAEENFLQSIKLNSARSLNYYNLADVYREMGNIKEALTSIREALKIEPNNPRYLDAMVEISIIAEEKADAWGAYKKLKQINPENNKLPEMKKKIDKL